jgi:hypothetical protein
MSEICVWERAQKEILEPKRDYVTEEWRILRTEELYNLCSSTDIIRAM